MKLSIVFPVLNQHEMFKAVYEQTRKCTDFLSHEVEFLIIDNGSDTPMDESDYLGAKVIRNEESIGVYPTFKQGFENTTGEIVAFFHSDFVVWEPNWSERVIEVFDRQADLGLIGFIGSDEIDTSGGRGLGTTSNFMGYVLKAPIYAEGVRDADTVPVGTKQWGGSAAHHHGKVSSGFSNAAVVDGCSMILRRSAWEKIGEKQNFPLHHFYDRLISTQILEAGLKVGVLGIACDHFSGQTANTQSKYQFLAWKWLTAFTNLPIVWANGHTLPFEEAHNYDIDLYQVAERMWMEEYRPKGFIPYKAK